MMTEPFRDQLNMHGFIGADRAPVAKGLGKLMPKFAKRGVVKIVTRIASKKYYRPDAQA